MFTKLIQWFNRHPTALESYILSKNPTNAAEVEYWTIQYNHAQHKGAWL